MDTCGKKMAEAVVGGQQLPACCDASCCRHQLAFLHTHHSPGACSDPASPSNLFTKKNSLVTVCVFLRRRQRQSSLNKTEPGYLNFLVDERYSSLNAYLFKDL